MFVYLTWLSDCIRYLANVLNITIYCNNASSDFISVDLVQTIVRHLKTGKAADFEGLMADHICLALLHILYHWFICHVCSQCCINIVRCLMILAEESLYIYLRM